MSRNRITEDDMADAVRKILAGRPGRKATFAELRELVPEVLDLSTADRAESPSRPGEEKWHQIVRNLVAHQHEGFIAIRAGLRLQHRRTA